MVPTPSKISTCGTVTVGSWPHDKISEDTAMQVKFDQAFDYIPSVLVQLAAIDAHSPKHKRIETWASDITRQGFRLHVRTWDDSVTWMVKVSWIASSDYPHVQLGTRTVKDLKCRAAESESEASVVQFPKSFSCAPSISLGWSALDASGDANLCLAAEAEGVCCRDFTLNATSWQPGSIAWSTTMSWIACSPESSLQAGIESFGSCLGSEADIPIKSGTDRCIDVMFAKSYEATPSVALALVGLDATRNTPLRIDTWASNVTRTGFQLHIRSWSDSVTLFAKVAWVAAPDSIGFSVERIASHSPPQNYVIQGPSLGEGVMAVAHCARNVFDGKIYAVKTFKHPFNDHEESLRKELVNLSRLPRHNNLLRYYTSVIEANRLHIVTECLDALKFAQLMPAPYGLFASKHHPNAVLKWIAQLFDGLAHMHAAGLMHRDLHSENVMVLRDPYDRKRPSQEPTAVRIIDFGGGKLFDASRGPALMSQPAGFWTYASPERRSGREFDERDDVWAGGCHLLELSSGIPIHQRTGCGPDGNDFATTPGAVQKAVEELPHYRCRETAYYVLEVERLHRPSAAVAHNFARMSLLPPTPACVLVVADRGASRKRRLSDSASRGPRRTRPCRAAVWSK